MKSAIVMILLAMVAVTQANKAAKFCGDVPGTKPVEFYKECPPEFPVRDGDKCLFATDRLHICCCKSPMTE
ncbi:hypothetical protein ABFA07_011052 [Porites harrisoni]